MSAPSTSAIRVTLTLAQAREFTRLESQAVHAFASAHEAMSRNDFSAASGFLDDLTGIRAILGHAFFQQWLESTFTRFAEAIRFAIDLNDTGELPASPLAA